MSRRNKVLPNVEVEAVENEEDESEDESVEEKQKSIAKPKRVVSQKHLDHLKNIRVKAAEVKKTQAEINKKAKELKKIENQKLAAEYDNYIEQEKQHEYEKIEQKILKSQEQQKLQQQQQQAPSKKIEKKIKKIIYEDDEDDEPDYSKLVATDNIQKLYTRALNERVFNSINSYANALRPSYY